MVKPSTSPPLSPAPHPPNAAKRAEKLPSEDTADHPEPRHHLVVGTAGHIDHGKTSLVLALTGIDCDRLREEKERGITIDLGFAFLEHQGVQIGFVDVPGHERFVNNALAGLGGIDLMMLVVAADEGIKPQTVEHLQICSLLQIPAGLVALTKIDLVDRDLAELAQLELEEQLRDTPFADVPILPVSSRSGAGVEELKAKLLEMATALERRTAGAKRPARLPIDRAFALRGLGTVVTGTLVSGTVSAGETLALLPGERTARQRDSRAGTARVRSLQVHGADRPSATAGERTSLQLAGVELADLHRGQQLVAPGAFETTRRLLVRMRLLAHAPRALEGWSELTFHLYSATTTGQVRPLEPRRLEPGGSCLAELKLEQPMVAARGDRFIVRRPAPARTLGGGEVLDPRWRRPRPRDLAAVLGALASDRSAAIRCFVERAGERGAEKAEVARRFGELPESLTTQLHEMVGSGDALFAPARAGHDDRWIPSAAFARITARCRVALKQYLDSNRMAPGMPKAEASRVFFPGRATELSETYLDWLARARILVVAGDVVTLPGRGSGLSDSERALGERIVAAYEQAGFTPPSPQELERVVNAAPKVFAGIAQALVREGRLARLKDNLLVSTAALTELAALVRAEGWQQFSVPQFKERFQLSRKWAIPLLEWLDHKGVTRRVGDERIVLGVKVLGVKMLGVKAP